jgi:hypothetical protein
MNYIPSFKEIINIRDEIIKFTIDRISKLIMNMEKYDKIYITSINEIYEIFKINKSIISFLLNGSCIEPESKYIIDKIQEYNISNIKYILYKYEIPRLCNIHKINKRINVEINFRGEHILMFLSSEIINHQKYDNLKKKNLELKKENQKIIQYNKFIKNVYENSINVNIQKNSKYENLLSEKNDRISFLENEIQNLRNFINPTFTKPILQSSSLPSNESFDTKKFLHNIVYNPYGNFS